MTADANNRSEKLLDTMGLARVCLGRQESPQADKKGKERREKVMLFSLPIYSSMLWVDIYRLEIDYDRDVMSVNVVIEFDRG
jgi:hypothetical protein